jgi:hypothetical protein
MNPDSSIDEYKVCVSIARFRFDASELLALPPRDLILVALLKLDLGFLKSPVQALLQYRPNTINAQVLSQPFSDQLCHTFRRPQVVWPTVCSCTLRKEIPQQP